MTRLYRKLSIASFVIGAVPAVVVTAGLAGWPLNIVAGLALLGAGGCCWFYRTDYDQAKQRFLATTQVSEAQITVLKQDIRALAKTNARYECLMSATNDGVMVVDGDGKIVDANWTVAELLGYESSELPGHFLPDFAPATERKRLKEFITDAQQDGKANADDIMLNHHDGASSWFDGRACRVEHDGLVQIVLKDMSESKRQFILTEKEISFIHELSRTLPLLQDFDQMLDRILGMLSETLTFHAFTLVLAEPNDTMATICVGAKTKKPFLNDVRACVADVLSELGDNIDSTKVDYVIERKSDIKAADKGTVGSQILLPMAIVNGVAGLFSCEENAFKKEDLSLFSTMVSGISSLYIAYRSYQQVQHLSVTDSLTGLYNRRKFFEELLREVERVSRYEAPLSLIMLDIDHFKKVNDDFGHQMGDEVLRTLSDVLRANTRKTDVVARYGGEEFIILLTETPLKGAKGVADRIKSEVEKAVVLGAAIEVKFTVSIGLADYQPRDTADTLVGRADKALYTAKKNGRNRVELAVV